MGRVGRRGRRVLTAVCTMLLTVGAGRREATAETEAATARVRSSDHALASLIDQATKRSQTFRSLVTTIQASDGIVYVEPGTLRPRRTCVLEDLDASQSSESIPPDHDPAIDERHRRGYHECDWTRVAAWDRGARDAPAVKDGVSMFSFLQRTARTDSNRFETAAAVNAGDAVYDELRRGNRNAR